MKRLRLGALLGLVVFSLVALPHQPTTAQETWRVESVRPVVDLVEEYNIPTQIYVAPDARHVAYGGGEEICILDLYSLDERCLALERELAYSFPMNDFYPPLSWSPDSTKLALVGMPFHYMRDTDLGLVDVPSLTFTNLSDDRYAGKLFLTNEAAGAFMETQPVFSITGQLAVERAQVTAEGRAEVSTIAVADLASGDFRELSRLPGHEKYEVDTGSVIGMDWSPDGATLAVSLRHREFDELIDGIWLLDVESAEWTPLVSLTSALVAMQTAIPAMPPEGIQMIAPVKWSPDGSRLLFWAGDSGSYAGMIWAFWLELDTGEISVVSLPTTPHDTPEQRLNWPFQAVWSPDGSYLLVAARFSLGIDPEDLVPLDPAEPESGDNGLFIVDPETGESTLLGHLPRTIYPYFTAAWAPDGSVIAGGYSFNLTHE